VNLVDGLCRQLGDVEVDELRRNSAEMRFLAAVIGKGFAIRVTAPELGVAGDSFQLPEFVLESLRRACQEYSEVADYLASQMHAAPIVNDTPEDSVA